MGAHAQAVILLGDLGTRFAQLVEHGVELGGTGATQQHVTARRQRRAGKGARLDAIGNDAMRRLRRVQSVDALDADAVRAVTLDARAHRDQQRRQIGDLGLLGRVLQDRLALRQRGRHQQVLGAGDGDHVRPDARAAQAVGLGDDVAALHRDVRTHGLQPLDVLIHRPRTDGAAAGQRHHGHTEASQQRPEHEDRGPHRLDQFVGRHRMVDGARIEVQGVAVGQRFDAHLPQQGEGGLHVPQPRHVAQSQRFGTQQRRADLGQRGVLRSGDGDVALQAASAANQKLVHESSRMGRHRLNRPLVAKPRGRRACGTPQAARQA